MDFLSKNKLLTTTMISVDYGSDTTRYLFDGNTELKWISTGFALSTSATMINISFTAATVLSNIIIKNHNVDEMYIYADNTTSNCLFFMVDNDAVNTYVSFPTVTVSSIQITCARTFPMAQTRKIGDLALVEKLFTTEKDPTVKDLSMELDREQSVHQMPDGGVAVYNLRDNFRARIKWRFISQTMRDQFKSVFEDSVPFHVVLNPEDYCWDGLGFEVDWIGNFDFKPEINNESQGFVGMMDLRQTSRARS